MNPISPVLAIRTIVVPTDGSAWAEHAFSHAALLAAAHDATVHVLTVRVDGAPPPEPVHPSPQAASGEPDVVEATVEAETLEDGILEYAAHADADLIVMATHGRRGVRRLIDGSVAEHVIRQAGCPVLALRPEAVPSRPDVSRILVAVDFSEPCYLAAAHAAALARRFDAALELVHAVEPALEPGLAGGVAGWVDGREQKMNEAHRALADFADELGVDDVRVTCRAVSGPVVASVVEAATSGDAALIVVGSHGRTGLRRVLLGSVAEEIVRQASCPVLVIKTFAKSLVAFPDAARATP